MSERRTICAFSGKRGGYGAYVPLMHLVEEAPDLELLILLGDMHASAEFGSTVDEARSDFPSSRIELIEMGTGRSDSTLARAENLSACLGAAARLFDATRPDIVLVHGDRGEHLMVAFAALNLGIAVAHTQGGDRSGNIDELQRHAITKLSHLHFPESQAAADRIRAMGEDEWRIHTVGSTYIDRIVGGMYVPAAEARALLGLGPDEPFLLAVVHPETFLSREQNRRQSEEVFAALEASGLRTVVTYPCSDPGYEGVLEALDARAGSDALVVRRNIENDVYLGLMASAVALVGNSSAALVEAPYLRLPAVNVGARQRGRERDPNVIDVEADRTAVAAAIDRTRDESFRRTLTASGRLGDGHAAERIVEVLRGVPLDDRLLRKQIAY